MTLIMGILNVTPDSFSDGGRYLDAEAAIARGMSLLSAGAHLIDVGGESTRPGSQRVTVDVERDRVLPVVTALAAAGGVVSIDTMNASTALAAVAAGASIVNDVSGGLADPDMIPAVAETNADFAIGHWRGHSFDMYARADYGDVAVDVAAELRARIAVARAAGFPLERLIADPGLGFGKRGLQNWQLLGGLSHLTALGARVLVGASRKGFLADTIGADGAAPADSVSAPAAAASRAAAGGELRDEQRRDLATAVTSVLAAQAGAWAVRVHDVAATRDALRVADAWADASGETSLVERAQRDETQQLPALTEAATARRSATRG